MRGRLLRMVGAIAVGLWLGTGVHAQTQIPADQREEVERRVEEMEAQLRRIRDETIAGCRGAWTRCTNKTCKKIPIAETSRWQACQDACGEKYEHCKAIAYERWPEGE